jgi:hypothetical protein
MRIGRLTLTKDRIRSVQQADDFFHGIVQVPSLAAFLDRLPLAFSPMDAAARVLVNGMQCHGANVWLMCCSSL